MKLRKATSVLLAVIIALGVFSAVPFGVSAAEITAKPVGASGVTGDCTWTLDDEGTLTISGSGAMGDYPDAPQIHEDGFPLPWGHDIKKVVIESGVTKIGISAFTYCESLKSVAIADSVTSIGDYAFNRCLGINNIVIPNSVTVIGKLSFSNCRGLKSVNIPGSVKKICATAFNGCTSLESISVPDSVDVIENNAFFNTAWYDSQPDGLVYAGKIAYQYKGTMPDNTSIVIRDGTKAISKNAFYECKKLVGITIPDSVETIGEAAFCRCTALTSADIPASVKSIEDSAFLGCSALQSAVIPKGITEISYGLFNGCSGLQSVVIPDSVTVIGGCAFQDCSSLQSVDIPDNVTEIRWSAFKKCTALSNIGFPGGVSIIGNDAFLNTAWFNSQPNGMVYIGNVAYPLRVVLFARKTGVSEPKRANDRSGDYLENSQRRIFQKKY